MCRRDRRKNGTSHLLLSPTTTQNGGEKSIEYCQLKAAILAGEDQQVFVAAIFTLHAGKAVVEIAKVQIPVNDICRRDLRKTLILWR